MHIYLDLDESIRPGLDILANEIVISLKKRGRFKQNPEIYRPGLVLGEPARSLLDYELERVERLHAELGRYTYCYQEPFNDLSGVQLVIRRPDPEKPIRDFVAGTGSAIVAFYQEMIRRHREPGSDSSTFGEAVTADVEALLYISERINLGKLVAEYKFQQAPDAFVASAGDPGVIRKLIVNKEREAEVLDTAAQLARHYEFDEDQATEVFLWMIDRTVELEVNYIRHRLDAGHAEDE
jgi:chorismate mutase